MSLIGVDAIRGRCASFMILSATVSEIIGERIYFSSRPLDETASGRTGSVLTRSRSIDHQRPAGTAVVIAARG